MTERMSKMSRVEAALAELVTAIIESPEYQEYSKQKELMRQYPELKEKCDREGKKIILTEEVIKELDKKYPLQKPTVIINGVPEEVYREALERLSRAQDLIIMLQNENTDLKLLQADIRNEKILLEDRQKRAEEEITKLEQELEIEKSKTWVQKLFKK